MTLYQIDPNLHPDDPMQELVKQWIGTVLVPVEPCEHGKYDAHEIPQLISYFDKRDEWCPGARVGEETL